MAVFTWTEIESFHNIRKYTKEHPEILNGNPVVFYKPKVKLHGTNAGIQCHHDGIVVAQSRTNELTEESDNAGFAKWVKSREGSWRIHNDLIIYGEWCGPGIQKGVAISEIPKKVFAVFAARPMAPSAEYPDTDKLIVEPSELEYLVRNIADTYVLPWYDVGSLEVKWDNSAEELQKDITLINKHVELIEANDPWVEKTFNVKGTGEGLVYYPVSDEHLGLTNFNNLVFKAKGEKHKNIKTAAPAQLNPEAAASVNEFIELVLTSARLEQGATAVGGYDLKLTGQFVSWIEKDVKKETQDELEASKLDWKQVTKPLIDKARTWYIAQSKIKYLG